MSNFKFGVPRLTLLYYQITVNVICLKKSERDLQSVGLLPKWFQYSELDQAEPRNLGHIRVSTIGGKTPRANIIICNFPRCVIRKLDQKRSTGSRTDFPVRCCYQKGQLDYRITMLAPSTVTSDQLISLFKLPLCSSISNLGKIRQRKYYFLTWENSDFDI